MASGLSVSNRSLRRACVAFILRTTNQRCQSVSPVAGDLPVLRRHGAGGCTRLLSTSTLYQPPSPPPTHGVPVFPDIDFSVASNPSSESTLRNSDPSSVFVVTGASRGIGLQFVKSLLENTRGNIVACCRSPQSAALLNEYLVSTTRAKDRVEVLPLDLENQTSIEQTGKEIRSRYSRVDLLLNVAGILGDAKKTPGPERSLTKIDRKWFEKTLAVNLIGPVMLTKELAPLLMQKRRGGDDNRNKRPAAVVVNMSARVGSISDNSLGGWYSYRVSKAGLNQATRTLALELKRHSVWCISCHPGTTDTKLSQPFQANVKTGALFPVEFTVTQLKNVIDSLTEANSGGFYDWAGKSISF